MTNLCSTYDDNPAEENINCSANFYNTAAEPAPSSASLAARNAPQVEGGGSVAPTGSVLGALLGTGWHQRRDA